MTTRVDVDDLLAMSQDESHSLYRSNQIAGLIPSGQAKGTVSVARDTTPNETAEKLDHVFRLAR
jgi:hypothetical protein